MAARSLEFHIRQTAKAIRRNPLIAIAAVTNVAVTLAILGAFFLLTFNLHHMASLEAQSAAITCELAANSDPGQVENKLLRDTRISRTEYFGKEDNLERLEKWFPDDSAFKVLGNPLPATIVIHLKDPEQIQEVCRDAEKIEGISRARYPEQIMGKILAVARGVKIAGVVVAIILALATITVISTTIQLTIHARHREIHIMQLVGATDWFIRVPFLLEGLFDGLVGGMIAATGVIFAYWHLAAYIGRTVDFIALVDNTQFIAFTAAGMVIAGAIFGTVGSFTGVRRYLQTA